MQTVCFLQARPYVSSLPIVFITNLLLMSKEFVKVRASLDEKEAVELHLLLFASFYRS
jgi:hypothetical protein